MLMRASLLLLLLCSSLHAQWHVVARVKAERFDAAKRAWSPLPADLLYQGEPEGVEAALSGLKTGSPLTARLDFKRLPHYGEWVAQRQAESGSRWAAIQALLNELGDGPAIALVSEALPAHGPIQVKLGLRRGSRFELYATVPGQLRPCGQDLCFEPGEPVFASQSAALAWKLLKPLAGAQLKSASKR